MSQDPQPWEPVESPWPRGAHSAPVPQADHSQEHPAAEPGYPTPEYPQQGYPTPEYPQQGYPTAGPAGYWQNPAPSADEFDLSRPIAPENPGRRRGRTGLIVGLTVTAVVGAIVGGGAFAYSALNGGGDQPEQHLPSTTVAVAEVDLDPTLGQKVDAFRFVSKFPGAQGIDTDDPRKSIWEDYAGDQPDAPAWKDVEPWLGQRAAVALVPAVAPTAEPIAVVLLQVSDEGKATTTLKRLTKAGSAVGDGWAYLSKDAASAQAVLTGARQANLATNTMFGADLAALGGRGIAQAWFDYHGLGQLLKNVKGSSQLSDLAVGGGSVFDSTVHGALTLRFNGTSLEMLGKFSGLTAGTRTGTPNLGVAALPADTLAAIGIAGIGDRVGAAWPALRKQLTSSVGTDPFPALQKQTGLRFPADLQTLLGNSTTVAVGAPGTAGQPSVALRVQTAKAFKSPLAKLLKLTKSQGMVIGRHDIAGGYVAASSQQYANTVATRSGLGASERFTKAVPDAAGAGYVVYADIAGLTKAYGDSLSAADRTSLEAFDSFGLSATQSGETATLHLLVTTR